ncbi:PSME3-interacting protein [Patella vulgata]|uniref:PSME3-interacting protein n=1 Tax=Patella vulgata TaxID=6465 RepID=UPI00217F39EA|nr:PSME3-interacting protein [Patella vulgata]XP_055955563.1 PSME3-interacting protein [Patella vulgata]
MSFGGNQPSGSGFAFKQFESAEEVAEKKKKRQEDWERVRKPDEPLECPEEDTRSLFEQLQDQKLAKEDEWNEQHKLKNSIKGLEDDEIGFLDEVSERQIQLEKAIRSEEKSVFEELKNASISKLTDDKKNDKPSASKSQPVASSSKRSQQSLLAGAVKRKSTDDHGDSKIAKLDKDSDVNSSPTQQQTAKVIGILPGIGFYDDHSSDSDSTSSDSSIEISQPIKIRKVIVQQADG